MDQTPHARGGILSAAKRMLGTLRDVAENRVELFLLEAREERGRMFSALLLAAGGVLCALMTLVLATATLVVVFWDTHRVLVLGVVTIVYAVGAVAAFVAVRSRLRKWQPFSATLDQIRKDRECFKKPN